MSRMRGVRQTLVAGVRGEFSSPLSRAETPKPPNPLPRRNPWRRNGVPYGFRFSRARRRRRQIDETYGAWSRTDRATGFDGQAMFPAMPIVCGLVPLNEHEYVYHGILTGTGNSPGRPNEVFPASRDAMIPRGYESAPRAAPGPEGGPA